MNQSVPTDEKLIEKIRSGQRELLEGLVARYEDRVYALALRMTGNRQDAEDVLQDTFLNVVRSLDSFRGSSSFATWLYRIATNAALTRLRQQKRKNQGEGEFLDEVYSVKQAAAGSARMTDWSAEPEGRLLGEEARTLMEEAIGELPDIYRTVFVLRDVEGLPASEVADILDLSVPAVKSRLHRARMYLRNRLSDYFSGEAEGAGEESR